MRWSSPLALIPVSVSIVLLGTAAFYTFDSEKAREKRYQRLAALKKDHLKCSIQLEAERAKEEGINAKAYRKSLEKYRDKLRIWVKENASLKQMEDGLRKKYKQREEEFRKKLQEKKCPPPVDCKKVKALYQKKLNVRKQELKEWKKRRCPS